MTSPIAAIPKFCRSCGAVWQAHWTDCQACRGKTITLSISESKSDRTVQRALSLYFCLLAMLGIGTLAGAVGGDSFNVMIIMQVMMSALVIGWAACEWRTHRDAFLRLPPVWWFGLAILLALPTYWVASSVGGGMHYLMGGSVEKMITPFKKHGFGYGALILSTAVQPAIIEELAFRGVVLGGLRRVLTTYEAVVVSALMFMTLHLSPVRFPHTLALGLVSGTLRVRSKSIFPCMALHFTHNFLCIAMEWMAR
jgi:membrane protease YdiL (CAAX protease family)